MTDTIPIAVVGMGCRLPGGATSPEKLWELLSEGRSGWREVPADRWNRDAFHNPYPEAKESLASKSGYFLHQDISAFDARFFGIAPFEASAMDPQQRLLLETTYEALENGGITLESIRGSDTAVFVAAFARDYDRMGWQDLQEINKSQVTGTGDAIISNRLSYFFDLNGPSLTLDTGCSGSLVALHLACQGLRSNESKMAIVGGTQLLISPNQSVAMSSVGMVNPDGRCYVFDSRGSGYARGEGVSAIILKRLDQAMADGNHVHGVIVNSGANQDGKTGGLSVPSGDAQAALMRSVYAKAGLDPCDTLYVEAHGTGTKIGDKEEVGSISSVFSDGVQRKTPLVIGSVKSNIGHLEACSGLAGLLKSIMILKNGVIPPNLDFKEPKPTLKLDERNVELPLEPRPLCPPQYEGPRRVSVNSFGYGGTNCHVILESVDSAISSVSKHTNGVINGVNGNSNGTIKTTLNGNGGANGTSGTHPATKVHPTHQIFVLSAFSEKSLLNAAAALHGWLLEYQPTTQELRDLSYTLAFHRSQLPWRCSVVASSFDELAAELKQIGSLKSKAGSSPNVAFVFTGQGVQWHAMGRELLSDSQVFRASLVASEKVLHSFGCDWNLIEELSKSRDDTRLGEAKLSQPATTAVQIALIDFYASLGVVPSSVVGHSSGEIAAAYAAGALSHKAAIEVSYQRGLFSTMAKTLNTTKGSMMAVGVGEEAVLQYLGQTTKGLATVACVNSPNSTTISGDEAAIDELKDLLDTDSVFCRKLKVDTAYHSHHMKRVASSYLKACHHIEYGSARETVAFYSSVTGERKFSDFGPDYWTQNLVSKVRFSDALDSLSANVVHAKSGSDAFSFVEIGPHSALAGPTRQTLTHSAAQTFRFTYLSALSRGRHATQTALSVIAKLNDLGAMINVNAVLSLNGSEQRHQLLSDLPSYSWDHANFWHESRLSRDHRFREFPYHDLCGVKDVMSNLHEPRWRYHVNQDALPWVKDHVVDGFIIFPGSGYVCMVIEAMKQLFWMRKNPGVISKFVFRNISFSKSIIVPEHNEDGSDPEVELQLTFSPAKNYEESRWERFRIFSYSRDGTWNEHCSGLCAVDVVSKAIEVDSTREDDLTESSNLEMLETIQSSCTEEYEAERFYEDMRSTGNNYGPNFAILDKVYSGNSMGFMTMRLPAIGTSMPYGSMQPHTMHPIVLDAIHQLGAILFKKFVSNAPVVPVNTGEVWISADITTKPGEELLVALKQETESDRSSMGNTYVYQKDSDGKLKTVLRVSEGQMRAIGDAQIDESAIPFTEQIGFRMAWDTDAQFLTNDLFKQRLSEIDMHALLNIDSKLPEEASSMSFDEVAASTITVGEQAACIYLREALQRVDSEKIEVKIPHMVKLLTWIRKWCSSTEFDNFIGQIGGPQQEHQLLSNTANGGVEGRMLDRICRALPEILSGETDPLAIMLEGNLLNAFYSNRLVLANYTQMAEYVRLLAFKKPHMRFLEIGAGTGAGTMPLLQALTREDGIQLDRYDYTDVSVGFFEQARNVFANWKEYIEYKILDIERDPLEQGFEAESYDVIICSNVLHATKNMDATMKNVRNLIKPGGKLVLIEVTRLTAANNTIFGCLPGWWAFEDGREDSPILSTTQWHDLALRNGFNGLDICCPDHNGPTRRTTMMVTEAVKQAKPSGQPSVRVKILRGSKTSATDELVDVLSLALQPVEDIECQEVSWDENMVDSEAVYIIVDTSERPILLDPSHDMFDKIQKFLTNSQQLLWVSLQESDSPSAEALKGLVRGSSRVLRRENALQKLVTVDVQSLWKDIFVDEFAKDLLRVAAACFWPKSEAHSSNEYEFGYVDGKITVPRVQKDNKFFKWVGRVVGNNEKLEMTRYHQPDRPLRLEVETPGLLGSLRFVDDESLQKPMLDREIEVEVRAYGVNFKDVFIALGQMVPGVVMVGEACGIVTKVGDDMKHRYKIGDRVTGVGAEPFASHARLNGNLSYPLPESISFEVGATIPTVYLTAWYSLVHIARLEAGQSILIHAASGGVGQAAIQLAKHIGATVFATVGSSSKQELLTTTYGIPKEHVFSTRARNFKTGILRLTDGVGVDVVLNSLSGESLNDSWEVVAPLGTFVEIGKADIYKRSNLVMAPFDKAITFAAVDLVRLFKKHSPMLHRYYGAIFELFERGAFYAVTPVNVVPIEKVEDAFRLIAARKHTGKVVLQCDEEAIVKATLPKPPRLILKSEGTYVVAGGLGDLGRRIVHWLAAHGAGHVVTLSRRTISTETRDALVNDIKQAGATLHIVKCDILEADSVRDAVKYCSDLPPVRGVVHGGMVLRDHPMTHMTQEDFNAALGPKVHGTINLDQAFASNDLDFFLMMSSLTCIMGNPGQSNYAAGNAFEDAFAHAKSSRPTHTKYISLNLGAVQGSDSIRLVAIREQELIRNSAVLMSFEEMWMVFEYAMGTQGRTDGCVQEILGFSRDSMMAVDDRLALENPLFCQLPLQRSRKGGADGDDKVNVPTAVKAAKTLAEAEAIITTAIVAKFAIFMDKDIEEVAVNEPLGNIGLDSLVSIELKNWMVRTFQVVLQTTEIAGAASILELGQTLASRSKLISDNLRASKPKEKNDTETAVVTKKTTLASAAETSHGIECCSASKELPRYPLVDLDEALEDLYSNISSHATSPEELSNLRLAVDAFRSPSNVPRKLYEKLRERADDPNCESWIADLLLRALHLERRYPLAPFGNFIGTHHDSSEPHSQAERAAVIAKTAYKFKQALELGQLEPDIYGTTPLCMHSWGWLFNAVREPNVGCDEMRKYPGNDFCAVLRQGHVFKVNLKEGNEDVTIEKLEATFQAIVDLDLRGQDSWAGIMTTDDRDSWGTNREKLVNLSSANADYFATIEKSAFIVCLDDNTPITRADRIKYGYIGDGFNRWHDKCQQWIVPRNGRSAQIFEHSLIDGLSTYRLTSWIQEAISNHRPNAKKISNGSNGHSVVTLHEYKLTTTSDIDTHIAALRKRFLASTNIKGYEYLTVPRLGKDMLLANGMPIKASLDLTIQVASRLFFGFSPAAWETVSTSHFHRGRPEIVQIVQGSVLEFVDACVDPQTSHVERRKLMLAATKDSIAYLHHASEGKNYFRLMDVLEVMSPRVGDEGRPKLFEDPVWKRVEPGLHIMMTIDDGSIADAAFNMFGENSLWTNYTAWEDRFTMSCVGPAEKLSKWDEALQKAAEIVEQVITSK